MLLKNIPIILPLMLIVVASCALSAPTAAQQDQNAAVQGLPTVQYSCSTGSAIARYDVVRYPKVHWFKLYCQDGSEEGFTLPGIYVSASCSPKGDQCTIAYKPWEK